LLLILIGKPCTNDGIDWKSIRKGEERVFKRGSYTLEELTLMIEKFVGNFPPARRLSEMHELHCAWMAGAASATIVVSKDDGK